MRDVRLEVALPQFIRGFFSEENSEKVVPPYRGNGCIWKQETKFHMNFSFRQRKGAKNHRDDGKTGDGTPKYIKEEDGERRK